MLAVVVAAANNRTVRTKYKGVFSRTTTWMTKSLRMANSSISGSDDGEDGKAKRASAKMRVR